MVNPRTHVRLPDEITGYAFDPAYSWWSTIVAEESTNLILNPSFEKINDADFVDEYDAAGTWEEIGEENIIVVYPSVGAAAGRRITQLVGGSGLGSLTYTTAIAVTPGLYTFSLDLYVLHPPARVTMTVLSGGVTVVASRAHYIDRKGWFRYHLTYRETATSTRTLRLSFNNPTSTTVTMYSDAWQFERKDYPTTYLDGDMMGFQDVLPYSTYFWHGVPHGSFSTRLANTGSGGRVISWSDTCGFRTTSIVGLQGAPLEQRVQTLGNGKAIHRGVETQSRDFTITGRIFGNAYGRLLKNHNDLMALLRPNNTASDDQLVIRYQEVDDDDQLVGFPLDVVCVYTAGLQGNLTNFYQEALALQFTAVQPYLMEVFESNDELTLVKELVSNYIVYRDEQGEYFNLGTGATTGGVVDRVGFLADGRVVAFGNFLVIAGSPADNGAVWTGTTWQEIPDTDDSINDIDDGFRVGYPLTVGTGAGEVLEYDVDAETWTLIGNFAGTVNEIARDENGDIWAAGQFATNEAVTTTYNNVGRYNFATSAWETLGDGLTDPSNLNPAPLEVLTVLAPNDGFVYFSGTFEEGTSGATTTSANAVIAWDIANEVWVGMGAGFNEAANKLIQGQDGYIYATGPFSEDGTESYDLRGFARWNGYSWEEVFPLVRPGGVYGADGFAQDDDGIFWFYNTIIDPEDDLFEIEGLGRVPFFGWRNGVFYPPYMVDGSIRHFALGPGGRAIHAVDAYVGAGTPTKVPAMNRVTYEGTANAPVIVHIQGPGELHQIRSYSTEGGIYGRDNFVLSANESVILRNDLQRTLFYSNMRRNLYSRILSGASNMAALRLLPGENRISILVAESTEDTEGWLTWKNRYWAIGENAG